MNNIIQNMKSGFASIKELFGIILSDDNDTEGYDLYINSTNVDIAQTAQMLQNIENEQEQKRFSLFSPKTVKVKKNFNPLKPSVSKTSKKNVISNDVQLEGMEPEK